MTWSKQALKTFIKLLLYDFQGSRIQIETKNNHLKTAMFNTVLLIL